MDSAIPLTPFISVASLLVDRVAEDTGAPTDEVLLEIETWLAAHFYCIRDPRTVSERAGDVWATYQSKVALGLDVTHYGQMAMRLDPTGVLKSINDTKRINTRRVGAFWMGEDECSL